MSTRSGLSSVGASGKTRGNTPPTTVLGELLLGALRANEEVSLALLSIYSVDQMKAQLDDAARLTVDVALTHLARLPRGVALDALEQLLDAHRMRVLPELRQMENLDLFGRLFGGRS